MTPLRTRAAAVLATATATLATALLGPAPAAAAGHIRLAGGATAVANSYLVVLHDGAAGGRAGTRRAAAGVPGRAADLAARYGGVVRQVYSAALNGFAVSLPERAARRLALDPAVAHVEQDHAVALDAGVQLNPPSWGLDRIDQRTLPLDRRYAYPNTAPNVRAYVLDTGIRFTHTDFGGRATSGFDAVDGGPADDCNGHGTAIAGIVGGRLHGVAKEVRLVAVRILSCTGSGTIAGVVAGVDWVTANAVRPATAVLAIGGSPSPALDTAVTNSINSGIPYAVPSGNSATNACNVSPARVPGALTTAASTITDTVMSSTNTGSCIDLFAPGAGITTTWHTSDTATNTLSGSSWAAAHVTGAAALVLSGQPGWTAAQVAAFIVGNATVGVLVGVPPGTPNRLLFIVP